MPRGQGKRPVIHASTLGGGGEILLGRGPAPEDAAAAVEREVAAFAQAWFQGDSDAMLSSLHPDCVVRTAGFRGENRPDWDSARQVSGVLGPQGRLGGLTEPGRRRLRVRVLDVRRRSASAVAELGGWVLHVHLARAMGRWRIVNAMWEMAV
jgi:hypothetical protein